MVDRSYELMCELKTVIIEKYNFENSKNFSFLKGFLVSKKDSQTVYYRRVDTIKGIRHESNKRLMPEELLI